MKHIPIALAAMLLASCAAVGPTGPGIDGKPLGEFFDDLKSELRAVHWRVRSDRAACGTPELREIDLRNAQVVLELARIGTASVDGEVKLVALPLGDVALTPFASASAERKWTQQMTVKLDVTGPSRLFDLDERSTGAGAVAQSVNAAIDGFVRSSADEPCVRLSALKLSLVIDVTRDAAGGFKLVVPAAQLGAQASRRDVNTLTLSWDKVVSNALR
ncbi:MAG TPA: hypothetical protein VJ891_07735 [Casimicrobiaceae bacterium]|nr:hypothetical protein [Casimicrobiaceae bacterium]